jgi:hypothetical protein
MLIALTLSTLAAGPVDLGGDRPDIEAHLATVEADLRAVPTDHLPPAVAERRADLLDVLHSYRQAGDYPRNTVAPEGRERPVPVDGAYPGAEGRTPVFVDDRGAHCAVGYLLAADGQEALVADVVEGGNLRFVHEIDHPGLRAWAAGAGFTVEELARIQPSYDWEDRDGDGFVSREDGGEDCDDTNPDVHPDAIEICDDGIDNDCDDVVDEDEPEIPGDGIDNDCDGEVDEPAITDPDPDDGADDPAAPEGEVMADGCHGAAVGASSGLAGLALALLLFRRRRD